MDRLVKILTILLIGFSAWGQTVVSTSGKRASNNSYKMDFVVGQMFFNTSEGAGSIAPGTLQPEVDVLPSAISKDLILYLNSNGVISITPGQIDNGSYHPSGAVSLSLDKSTFSCNDLGANEVSLQVTYANSLSSYDTANLMVYDTIKPQVFIQNITVQLDANGQATITEADIDNGSNDACGIASLSLDKYTFSCADVGTHTVTLTVTDSSGNVSTGTASVAVEDNVAPLVSCPADAMATTHSTGSASVYVNGNSTFIYNGYNFYFVDPVPAGAVVTGVDISYTVFGYGSAHNRLHLGGAHLGDAYPGSGTQTKTISYSGSLPNYNYGGTNALNFNSWWNSRRFDGATIIFHYESSSATCGADVNVPAPVVSDACGYIVTNDYNNTTDASDNYPVGTTTINWTITDLNGNSVACQQLVTVTDNTLPDALTQNITVQLDANGQATITEADIDNGSNDACGIASLSLDKYTFSCADVGAHTVTLTVSDGSGNVSTGTASVTVEDNVAPLVSCPADVMATTHSTGSASGYVNGNSTFIYNGYNFYFVDPVPAGAVVTGVDISYTVFGYGSAHNRLHLGGAHLGDAYPGSGTQTKTISYSGSLPNYNYGGTNALNFNSWWNSRRFDGATITFHYESSSATCGADVNVPAPVVSDACGYIVTNDYNNTTDASDNYPVGTTTVNWTITDINGNSVACQQLVTVTDNTLPDALTQNITVQLDANGQASITEADIDNGSNDACGIASLSLDNHNFSCSDVGANTVTLTVTDNNGNVSNQTATVTVEDNVAPVALTQNITVQLDANGQATITETDIDNGSNDACGIASLSLDNHNFSCSDVGANTVTLTVTDNNGNVSTQTATVTVEDNVAPVALTQNITVQLDANGQATITEADIDNGSNDACGIASLSLDNYYFSCSDVGANTVILTVTDNNGNVTTQTATVTVEDNVAPVAITQNITVQLDANGQASITEADIDNGSNDACGIASLSLDNYNFSCSDVGANTVTLTVTDNNSNVSTQTATVTVEDNVAPIALTQNITVQLDANGQASITEADIDNGSNDACGIASLSLDNHNFDCDDTGANTVTLTVTDNNGNVSTQTATVTVEDNIDPVISGTPSNISVIAQPNDCTPSIPWTAPTASDNCTVSLTSSHNPGDNFVVGTTTVSYTATDASGNSVSTSFTVTVTPTPLVSTISAATYAGGYNISCNGFSDGSIDLSISGGCLPYTYSWSNGAASEDISSLTAGTYSVDITDANGTTISESITLTEPPLLQVTATSNGYLTGTGYTGYTLYLGVGPQSINLDAAVSGGVGPYTYVWSPDSTLTGEFTSTPVASPKISATYTVLVTDQNGCAALHSVYVDVIDVRITPGGNSNSVNPNNPKVVICERKGNANKGYTYRNKTINLSQLQTYLNNGATLGSCSGSAKKDDENEFTNFIFSIYPNPSNGISWIELEMEEASDVNIIIFDMKGKLLQMISESAVKGYNGFQIDMSNYARGVYFVKVQSGDKVQTQRLIKD